MGLISETQQEGADQHHDNTTSDNQHHCNATHPAQPTQCRRPNNNPERKENIMLVVEVKETILAQKKQTQQQRLGGSSERDDDVPANYTATQPSQLNQHNAEDDHTLTKRQCQGKEEEISELYMNMYRSASQHDHNQQRPATHNKATQTTRGDTTTKIMKRPESRWIRQNTRSLTSDNRIHELIHELCELT